MTSPHRPLDLLAGWSTPSGHGLEPAPSVAAWWGFEPAGEPSAVRLDGTRRTVIGVTGGPFVAAAQAYADVTGATLRLVSDPVELTDPAALPVEGSCVVVTESARLTFDLVEDIAQCVADQPGTRIGYLAAPDEETLDLVVRKSLATLDQQRAPRGGRGYVDEFRFENGRISGTAAERRLGSLDVLRGDYRTLLVGGHGDGLHIRLGDATICGLVGDAERSGGRLVRGGCRRTGSACKKSRASAVPVVLASDLRAELLALLSCKSFVTSEQIYPSNLSLLLAAGAGFAGSVVGVTRQLVFDRPSVLVLDALLQSGRRVGDVVSMLNEQQLRRGATACFALLGDPDARFAVPGGAAPALAYAGTAVWSLGAPDAVRASRPDIYLLHERRRTHVFAKGLDEPPRDASAEIDTARTAMTDIRRRLADGAALERVATSYATRYNLLVEAGALLGQVAAEREKVEAETWTALSAIVDTAYRKTLHPSLDIDHVRTAVRAWSDAMAELVASWFVHEEVGNHYLADHFATSMTAFRVLGPAYVAAQPCPGCGARLVAHDYDGSIMGLSPRTALTCAACGPVSTHGALRVALSLDGEVRPGGTVRFRVSLKHPPVVHGGPVAVALHVKARSRANPPATVRATWPPGAEQGTIELALPHDAVSDLWSATCGVTCDGEVSYARRLFAVVDVE